MRKLRTDLLTVIRDFGYIIGTLSMLRSFTYLDIKFIMAAMTISEQKLWTVQAEMNDFLITCHWPIYFEWLEFSWGFYKDQIQR